MVMETYNNLLDAGWRMEDIDGMDFLGYLRVRSWRAKKRHKGKRRPIDEVWPALI